MACRKVPKFYQTLKKLENYQIIHNSKFLMMILSKNHLNLIMVIKNHLKFKIPSVLMISQYT